MPNPYISGTGFFLPPRVITNYDLSKYMDTSDEWIRSRTGITQRHVVGENEASSDISTRIAETLMEKRGISADEIDVIIVAKHPRFR